MIERPGVDTDVTAHSRVAVALLLLVSIRIFAACGTIKSAFKDCEIQKHDGYNVYVCSDEAVDAHCHRLVKNLDSGEITTNTVHFNGCFRPSPGNHRDSIFLGRSHVGCLSHEIAHYEHPEDPAWVERNYPCVGLDR